MSGIQEIKKLMSLPENQICADCQSAKPDWASTTFGAFICLKCSGIHRSLGTHITLVRSCTLDSWPPKLLSVMQAVGNQKLNEYFEANLPENFVRPKGTDTMAMKMFIEDKYVARKYADRTATPPHLLLTNSTPINNSTPTFAQKEVPKVVKTTPLAAKTMSRSQSQSNDVDDAINLISSTPSQTRGKIRIKHSRTAKDTHVLSRSQSDNVIADPQPVVEVTNEDIDDFFAEKPKTKPKIQKSQTTKKVAKKPVEQPKEQPKPASNTEIDDFFAEPKSIPQQKPISQPKPQPVKKTIIDRPLKVVVEEESEHEEEKPKIPDLQIEDDENDKADMDDFFDNDDNEAEPENVVIKELPPLETTPKTINKNVEPKIAPKTQLKTVEDDDDAPNPFTEEEKPQNPVFENIEEENANKDEIDDFFSDNPKPQQQQPQPPQRQKTQYESCSFVPSKETYHPATPDKPEIFEKIEHGYDKAKEKANQAFDFLKGKINQLMNKDEPKPQPQPQPQPQQQPQPQPQSFRKPAEPIQDIDDFFDEPKPRRPVNLTPQQSSEPSKVYKIHKRGTPQPQVQAQKEQKEVMRPKKEESLDDALGSIVGDFSSTQSSSSSRATVQRKKAKIHRK